MKGLKDRIAHLIKWLIIPLILGFLTAPVFYIVKHGIFYLNGFFQTNLPGYWVFLLPLAGGLLLAGIWYRIDLTASGEGVPGYIDGVNRKSGFIGLKRSLIKFFAAITSLGFFFSGGLVGPVVLIGSGLGSRINALFKYFTEGRGEFARISAICGASAMLGTLFKTPLTGGFFAVEILFADSINYYFIFPAIISSAISYIFYSKLTGDFSPVFSLNINYRIGWHLFYMFLPAGFATFLGIAFIRLYKKVQAFYKSILRSWSHRLLFGAVLVSITGFTVYLITGISVLGPSINELINPLLSNTLSPAILILLVLLLGKMSATAFGIAGGASAGFTLPTIIIGALSGLVMGLLFGIGQQAVLSAMMICGIAAALTTVLNIPLTSLVLCIELFGHSYIVPAIIGVVVAYVFGKSEVIYQYGESKN